MNFLEGLAAEWYSYSGYFVRTNIKTRKRPKGGYDNEIDILAYSPETKELIHLEASGDAAPWKKRKERFLKKKFVYSKDDYEKIVGEKIECIKKIALVCFSKKPKANLDWGQGIEVLLVPVFIEEITTKLLAKSPQKEIVPEEYPLLRSIQFAVHTKVR